MAAATVRVGVIGVGRIGRLHAELLARQVRGAALAAVCDADRWRARMVAAELGVPAAEDVDSLLRSVDAVAICSSTATHADLIVAAARAGRAIFCEKPLSLDLAELDRALAACAEADVPFQIGFNRRYDPAHRSVRDAVASGTVGEPHLVRISSRDPDPPPAEYLRHSGGLFLDMMIHDFDMARYVTGSEVTEVYARGERRIYEDDGDVDTAVVLISHANGCLTTIDNSRRAAYGYDQRVEVFGSRGMASSENPPAHTGVIRTAEGTRMPPLPRFFLDRYVPSYVREWEEFAEAVGDGRTPEATAADARAPLVIGLAAWRSLREGRPVKTEEISSA